VAIRNNEESAGHKVRDVFCTKETRELEKEFLEIFSSYATTKKGKEMILTLTPSIDREELQKRFEDVKESEKLVKVMGDAKITRVREIISKAEIEKRSFWKSPLIAIRNRGIEAEIKRNYGDFMRVELVDSADKAEELLQKENIFLLIGEEEGFDEPGIINIKIDDLSEPCEIYPEFVANSFMSKKKVIGAIATLLSDFEELKDSYMLKDISVKYLKEVLALIEKIEAEWSKGETSFDELIYRQGEELNKEADRIMRSGGGVKEFKGYLEEVLVNMADELMLTGEDKNVLGPVNTSLQLLQNALYLFYSRIRLKCGIRKMRSARGKPT